MAVRFSSTPVESRQALAQRFERKFYLPVDRISLARGVLSQCCKADRDFPSEQINSLYFDTIGLDQHERSGSGDYYKDKVRIRWYGDTYDAGGEITVWVELKSRLGFAGTKQRRKLTVPAALLDNDRLMAGIIPRDGLEQTLAGFGYFLHETLHPIIRISYWRYRFCEPMTGQRVSLDCRIRSTMILPSPGNGERDLELPGGVVEIKGDSLALPSTLMQARMLNIDWTRFSKYSACLDSHSDRPGVIGRLSPSGRNCDFQG